MLGSSGEAEEVVQEVFMYVWERHEIIDETTASPAYLYRAARNGALNRIRRHRVEQRWRGKEAAQASEYADETASRDVEYDELVEAVQQAIERLPERCRQVYTLSRQEHLTYREIAETLDVSVKTVEAHMTRAFRRLHEMLGPLLSSILLIAAGLGRGGIGF